MKYCKPLIQETASTVFHSYRESFKHFTREKKQAEGLTCGREKGWNDILALLHPKEPRLLLYAHSEENKPDEILFIIW